MLTGFGTWKVRCLRGACVCPSEVGAATVQGPGLCISGVSSAKGKAKLCTRAPHPGKHPGPHGIWGVTYTPSVHTVLGPLPGCQQSWKFRVGVRILNGSAETGPDSHARRPARGP